MMQSDFNLKAYHEDVKKTSLNLGGSDKSYRMFSGGQTMVMVSSWDSSGSDSEGEWKQYYIHGRVGTGT